jgi:hypothetical protein
MLTNLAVAAVGAAGTYWFLVRPWHRSWGTTPDEANRMLPGDSLLPVPKYSATHSVTIDAPVAQVWPWIVQIGKDRGGFYSYDWIENSMGLGIRSVDRIVPELQNLKEGDILPLGPNNFGPVVKQLETNRVMVLFGDTRTDERLGFAGGAPSGALSMKPGEYLAVVWLFYVEPIGANTTRLIERFHLDYSPSLQNKLFYGIFLEAGAFVMERKMLLGLKERSERYAAPSGTSG